MSNIFKLSTQVEHVQSTVKDTIPSPANTPHTRVPKPKQTPLLHPFISRYTVHYPSPILPHSPFLSFSQLIWQPNCVCPGRGLNVSPSSMDSLITAENPVLWFHLKKNSPTLHLSFIWLTGWLAEEKRQRQTERNKQELRGTQTEIEGFFVCVSVCALTPLRNDLWQGSKFDFPLCVNVTGLENSWHSFRHCTPSAYHHPTLPNGNDTCPLEQHTRAL